MANNFVVLRKESETTATAVSPYNMERDDALTLARIKATTDPGTEYGVAEIVMRQTFSHKNGCVVDGVAVGSVITTDKGTLTIEIEK